MANDQINSLQFKKRYPRVYRHILKLYGDRSFIFDIKAAIALYLRNAHPPRCEVCNKLTSITAKFRNDSILSIRCKEHINTNKVITRFEIDKSNKHNYEILSIDSEYITYSSKMKVRCKMHGDYYVTVSNFIKGLKCQKCHHDAKSPCISKDEWITRSSAIHKGKYDYSNLEYKSTLESVSIVCPVHGVYVQNAGVHMHGHGCKKCSNDDNRLRKTMNTSEFIDKAKSVHGDTYLYCNTEYVNAREKVEIICKEHGAFEQVAYYHLSGNGCPTCGISNTTYKSKAEYEILEFLYDNGVENIEHSWRGLGVEIDIYIPEFKLAIEYDGVYWHSSNSIETDSKFASMHVAKTQLCENNDIELLHILDIEWNSPQREIWKSVILNKLKVCKTKIYARKCSTVLVPAKTAREFMSKNHLQGPASGYLNIGLISDGVIVAVGVFSKSRFNKDNANTYEILRFASITNTSVVGGFSKVIKEFARTHQGVLISYANRRWSKGNVYEATGFTRVSTSPPGYYYTDSKILWHRVKFQKHKLSEQLAVFDDKKSEVENMYENKFRRIWDCGHHVYELKL